MHYDITIISIWCCHGRLIGTVLHTYVVRHFVNFYCIFVELDLEMSL